MYSSGKQADSGKALLQQAYAAPEATAYAGPAPATAYATPTTTSPGWGGGNFESSYRPAQPAQATAYEATAWNAGSGYSAQATAVPPAAVQTYPAIPPAAAVHMGGNGAVNSAFFVEYAEVVAQIDSLANAEANLQKVNADITSTEAEIHKLERSLAKARKDQPQLEARINRNEHPRFLHYMQINRTEKVERLKKDLKNMVDAQERWTESLDENRESLQRLKQTKANFTNSVATKRSLEEKRLNMYEQAVSSVQPTPRLRQIESNISSQSGALSSETVLLQQVDQVVGTVRQAQNLYRESMQMLQRAMGANQTAQFVNVVDYGRGPDFFETANQFQRDRLINESQRPANEAFILIERAWSMFPQEARIRYPSLAAQIGKTPMPRLRGANFGGTLVTGAVFGDIGDFANNMHASNKIRENMGILQQSNQIVEVQLQLVLALRGAIATNVAAMEGQLKKLEGQKKEERDEIFKNVRTSVLGGYPSQGGASFGYGGQSSAYATAQAVASPDYLF